MIDCLWCFSAVVVAVLLVVHVPNNELIVFFHTYILFMVNDSYIPLGCAVTFCWKICLSILLSFIFFVHRLTLPNLFYAFHLLPYCQCSRTKIIEIYYLVTWSTWFLSFPCFSLFSLSNFDSKKYIHLRLREQKRIQSERRTEKLALLMLRWSISEQFDWKGHFFFPEGERMNKMGGWKHSWRITFNTSFLLIFLPHEGFSRQALPICIRICSDVIVNRNEYTWEVSEVHIF